MGKLPSVWSFAACSQRLLRPRLTSGEPSTASGDALSCKAARQISRGKARDLRSSPVASTPGCSEWHWASNLAALSPTAVRLVYASCSSGWSYACRFFPTTPRDVTVAVRLAVLAIRARRGLPPPGHFPLTGSNQTRAMPGTPRKSPAIDDGAAPQPKAGLSPRNTALVSNPGELRGRVGRLITEATDPQRLTSGPRQNIESLRCVGDCHGDFKSLSGFVAETYSARPTCQEVF